MPDDKEIKNSEYYDIGQAWQETKSEFSAGEVRSKATATAKLVGKTLFNTGLLAGKIGVKFAQELPYLIEKARGEREEIRAEYLKKTDADLLKIIRSSGGNEASSDEKAIARYILRQRHPEKLTRS